MAGCASTPSPKPGFAPQSFPIRGLLAPQLGVTPQQLRGLSRLGKGEPYEFVTHAQRKWLRLEYDPQKRLAWWRAAPEKLPGHVQVLSTGNGWVATDKGVQKRTSKGPLPVPVPKPLGAVGALAEFQGVVYGVARAPVSPAKRWVRIQLWDEFSRVPIAQYAYLLDRVGNEVRNVVVLGERRLLVLEGQRVYRVDLTGATRLDRSQRSSGPSRWETKPVTQLVRLGWRPVRKELVIHAEGDAPVAGMSLVKGSILALLRASSPPTLEWWDVGRSRITGTWRLPAGKQSWTTGKKE